MFHTLYTIIVIATNPAILTNVEALREDKYDIREAATKRLEALPGWTAFLFEHYANNAKDLEVRARCVRVHEKLDWKWRIDLILTFFPTIPTDFKDMVHRDYKVRGAAIKRLEYLPGLAASYFEYYAAKSNDLELRGRYQRMYERLNQKWAGELSQLWQVFETAKMQAIADRMREKHKATLLSSLAKLSVDDLKLAVSQGSCPIQDTVPLCGLGSPVKIVLKGQPVLLCCKDCIKKAEADPDKTLAKVKELKASPIIRLKRFLTKEQLQLIEHESNSSNNKK